MMSSPVEPPSSELVTAIILAAGAGRRFGGDKLFSRLGDRAVLDWSLRVLQRSPLVSSIVLVLGTANLERGRRLVERRGYQKVSATCLGGERRQDSVWNGLQEAVGAHWVAVHDGARPFLTEDILTRGFETAREFGAAVAAVPVTDTIKVVEPVRMVEQTLDRSRLVATQTPQIFRYASLVEAYRAHPEADVTDDAELVERAGMPVATFAGSVENLKITTPADLALARVIARGRRCA